MGSGVRSLLLGLLLAGCAPGVPGSFRAFGPACVPASGAVPLPEGVPESSGIGYSLRFPGLLWTHNDAGHGPLLYGIERDGSLRGTVRLDGAAAVDWEDLEVAPCDAGSCIWVGDVGDNAEGRREIALLRIPEVEPGPDVRVTPDVFPAVIPDGPRDIEALYVLPGERVFLVTKGRNHPVTVYRYPPPLRPGERVVLEEVQRLTERRPRLREWVTGASASPDGEVVAVRSYSTLTFYRTTSEGLAPLPGGRVSLLPLGEPQGEAVAIGADGEVVLTSESGPLRRASTMIFLRCTVSGLGFAGS